MSSGGTVFSIQNDSWTGLSDTKIIPSSSFTSLSGSHIMPSECLLFLSLTHTWVLWWRRFCRRRTRRQAAVGSIGWNSHRGSRRLEVERFSFGGGCLLVAGDVLFVHQRCADQVEALNQRVLRGGIDLKSKGLPC